MVFLVRCLLPNPQTKQNNSVSEKVGNGVDCIRYKGLALTEDASEKFEQNQ